jgi:hypothetical protein
MRESTTIQHHTALNRVLLVLGDRPVDALLPADVAEFVGKLEPPRSLAGGAPRHPHALN